MSVESKKLAEFRISRNRLVEALMHISNISDKAAVALIIFRSEDNKKGGINFNNVLKSEMGPQFELYASYPIFNSEMACFSYFIEDIGEWPVYYIACNQQFIRSICTLPPITSLSGDNEPYLDLVFYNVKDGSAVKSDTVVYGDHKANVGSTIEHSDLIASGGQIVQSNGKDIEDDRLKSYS
jgi:hypothetical protein